MSGPVIRIIDVDVIEQPQLIGIHLDAPGPGDVSNTYSFELEGWALDPRNPLERIEVALGSRGTILQVPVDRERPDVAERFPEVPHALACGFRAQIGALHNRPLFEVGIRACLSDGVRISIGGIRGHRAELPSESDAEIQPLLLNTLGRSGSTWLAGLLGGHPEIIAYEPLGFETRVATYWISVFQELAQPSSYFRQVVATDLENDRRWWLADGLVRRPTIGDSKLEKWLGATAVESLGAMCRNRIEQFFANVAATRGKEHARYWLEKFLLEPVILDLLDEMYSEAREVILVRDFRDMVSSILAFNAKRGYAAFGRESVPSDAEFVKSTVRKQALALLRRWEDRVGRAHLVKYEDLVADPLKNLEAVCRYIGVDSSPATIRSMVEGAGQEREMDHHRTAIDANASIGRWRDDLPPDLAELCNEVLGPMLHRFGYDVPDERAA
jgi:hypothetical protein